MGHASIVYGNIITPTWKREDYNRLYRLNAAVIDSLPAVDEKFPFINKGMFLLSDLGQAAYKNQVIVFGASYKSVEDEWEEWLEKFESILKRLFWISVTIHLETELVGDHNYEWLIDLGDMHTHWLADDPKPITEWEFKGGPRKFDR